MAPGCQKLLCSGPWQTLKKYDFSAQFSPGHRRTLGDHFGQFRKKESLSEVFLIVLASKPLFFFSHLSPFFALLQPGLNLKKGVIFKLRPKKLHLFLTKQLWKANCGGALPVSGVPHGLRRLTKTTRYQNQLGHLKTAQTSGWKRYVKLQVLTTSSTAKTKQTTLCP